MWLIDRQTNSKQLKTQPTAQKHSALSRVLSTNTVLKECGIWLCTSPGHRCVYLWIMCTKVFRSSLRPAALLHHPRELGSCISLYSVPVKCGHGCECMQLHVWSPPLSSGSNFYVGFGGPGPPQHIPAAQKQHYSRSLHWTVLWPVLQITYLIYFKSKIHLISCFGVQQNTEGWLCIEPWNRNESVPALTPFWVYLWTPCM